jgi:Raf kinase inhibitor-like YbhB/YbcL family protein
MTFTIASPAFVDGGDIPSEFTCDGGDCSPALNWTDPPSSAKTFALIMDDPDAPGRTWVHWVLFDLPPGECVLPEGVSATPTLPSGARQGTNDFRRIGYGGPCPPAGPAHRYYFRLYALDAAIDLSPGATRSALDAAMRGHVLATAELMGRYRRRGAKASPT